MPGNLNVAFTADATQIQVASAVAKQYLSEYNSAVKALASEMKTTGAASQQLSQAVEDSRIAYNNATNAVKQLQSAQAQGATAAVASSQALHATGDAAQHAASGSSAVTRELIVMGHEAMQGRFSRIPGSMMVLAEHTGAVTTVMSAMTGGLWAAVAAGAALVAGFALLVIQANRTETALRGVYNAAGLMGQGAAAAETHARQAATAMQQLGVSKSDALAAASAIEKIGAMSEQSKAKLDALAPDLIKIMEPADSDKVGELFDKAFGSTASLRAFVEANHLLTIEQQNAFDAADRAKDAYAAQGIALDALKARIGGVAAQQKQADDAANRAVMLQMAGVSKMAGGIMQAYDQAGSAAITFQNRLQFPTGAAAPSADAVRANQVEQEYLGTLNERKRLQGDLVILQKSLAGATTDAARADLQAAIQANQARQAMLKDPGDSSWEATVTQQAQAAADKAVTAAAAAGQKKTAITEAGTKAELAIFEAASHDMSRTEEERNAMAARAIQLHMSLVKEDAAASSSAAKKTAEDIIAGYDQQLAEARGNLTQIQQIEGQKLAFLSRTYGQASSEYKKALSEQTSALREAVTEQTSEIKTAGTEQMQDRKAELELEVAQHRMTKSQEMAAEMAFDSQVAAGELQSLDAMIATLNSGTAAYALAMKERHALDVQFQLQHIDLMKQMQDADNQELQKTGAQFESVFRAIGSNFNSTVTGLIEGTTTWQKAELQAFKSILSGFLDLTEELLSNWLKEMAEEELANLTKNTIILGQDASWSSVIGGIMSLVALDSGTSYVPNDMVAQIHQGEMVIPKYDADIIRGGGGASGGGHTFHYSPNITGGSPAVERAVRSSNEDFKGYINNLMRNGQLALPGRAQKGT
jgi:hypothetical protein